MKAFYGAILGTCLLLAGCGAESTAQVENSEEQANKAVSASKQTTPLGQGYEMTLYTARDCEPCNEIKAIWPTIAASLESGFEGLVASELDCDAPENMEQCDNDRLLGAYPTIVLTLPSGERIEYQDYFTKANIMGFARKHVKH